MKTSHATAAENRLIPLPLRITTGGALLVCAAIVLLSARLALPPAVGPWAAAGLALLAVAALFFRSPPALHPSLFAFLWTSLPAAFVFLRVWPLNHLAPLALYALIVSVTPSLRGSVTWLRPGRIDRGTLLFVLATAGISGMALLAWYWLAKPDLRIHLGHIPAMPHWLFPLAGLAFALGNAAVEEAVFRGILMEALESALGPTWPALMIQAASFALFHYRAGFPNGWWGVAMVFVYGLMLGAIRRRSRGMLAPWLAHVAADITIFVILAAILLGQVAS